MVTDATNPPESTPTISDFDFKSYRDLLKLYIPRTIKNQAEYGRFREIRTELVQKANRRRKALRQLTQTEQRFLELIDLIIVNYRQDS